MQTREPECVKLKRRGAEYVKLLLSGKSEEEQLAFWMKRSECLAARQKMEEQKSDMPKMV